MPSARGTRGHDLRCLKRDPDSRFQSAGDLLAALDAATLGGAPAWRTAARAPPTLRSKRRVGHARSPAVVFVGRRGRGLGRRRPVRAGADTCGDIRRALWRGVRCARRPLRTHTGSSTAPTPRHTTRAGLMLAAAGFLLIALAIVAVPMVRSRLSRSSERAGAASGTAGTTTAAIPPMSKGRFLAVLPFRVLGSAEQLRYVADGIVEALSAKLFQLNQLRVASTHDIEQAGAFDSVEKAARKLRGEPDRGWHGPGGGRPVADRREPERHSRQPTRLDAGVHGPRTGPLHAAGPDLSAARAGAPDRARRRRARAHRRTAHRQSPRRTTLRI